MVEPKKVFISGPMRGKENMNKEAFMEAERDLRAAGFSVFNPAWLLDCTGFDESDFMTIDLAALSRCNCIYQLEGWEDSKGAKAEYMAALWSGKEIINPHWLAWYVGDGMPNDMAKVKKERKEVGGAKCDLLKKIAHEAQLERRVV